MLKQLASITPRLAIAQAVISMGVSVWKIIFHQTAAIVSHNNLQLHIVFAASNNNKLATIICILYQFIVPIIIKMPP